MSAVRALALVVLLGTLYTTYAHPGLWALSAKSCIAHPATGSSNGGHGAVRADTATSITVLESTGAVITAVCPGSSYTIKAKFDRPREALVTVTAGTINTNKDCSNRWASEEGSRSPELSLPWTVPCPLPGSTSVVKVTSASGSAAALGTTQLTLPVQASCALPACAPTKKVTPTPQPVAASSPAPATAAAATTPGANTTAPATDAAAAASTAAAAAAGAAQSRGGVTPAAAAPGAAGAAPTCTPSPLGYRCVADLPGGGRVHYSKGGAVPLNLCTRNTNNDMPGVELSRMLHFAIESPLPGYVALGFTGRPTKMFPSDVVIGSRDARDAPTLQTFRLQSYALNPAGDINRGWTSNSGLVRNGATTLMCFSRPVNTVNARVTSNLDTSAVAMIWAMSPGNALVEHTQQGSLLLNMDTGVSTSRADRVGGAMWDIVHGALMLAAFVALMPAAVLLARHKWLFGNPKSDTIKPGWFKLHIALQCLAVACAVASIVIIFVKKGWEPGSHRLFDVHKVLGMVVTALAVVQVGVGAARPDLKSPKRAWWRGGHYTIGWTTLLAGITNCFLGLFMVHDIRGHALLAWLLPTAILSGVWLLLGAALEVEKIKLQVAKLYNPKTHAFHGKQGLIKTQRPGDLITAQGDSGQVLHASGSNPGTPTHRRGTANSQI